MNPDTLNSVGLNLPNPSELCHRIKSMAMLDAILSPEWQYRYFSFNAAWNEVSQMGSVRDGSGTELYFVFTDGGCAFKINDAERYSATPSGIAALIPPEYLSVLSEPAFSPDDFTAFGWFDLSSGLWHGISLEFPAGEISLIASMLGSYLPMTADDYKIWADEYFETDLDISSVQDVFDHASLKKEIIQSLNGETDLADLAEDIEEIGYP